MKEYLNQVSSIENLEENGEFYDELVKNIKVGRADRVVSEMAMIAHSDRDTMTYNDLLDSARSLDERIVYDNGLYVLALVIQVAHTIPSLALPAIDLAGTFWIIA